MIKDYRIYEFDKKEKVMSFFEGFLINVMISILFYNSLIAMIPGILLVLFYFKEKKHVFARKRTQGMRKELKEFLNALIAALQTGRSLENAFIEATKDLRRYTEKDTPLVLELKQICVRISLGEPMEKMLTEFSRRSHLEELEYFSEVFSIGKRSGGNIVAIMKNTIRMIQERMEAEEEIATTITEKKLEFQLMTIIPLVIILYLRMGAGNLIHSLYGNVTGVCVMTVWLAIYGGCYLYGKRLLEI